MHHPQQSAAVRGVCPHRVGVRHGVRDNETERGPSRGGQLCCLWPGHAATRGWREEGPRSNPLPTTVLLQCISHAMPVTCQGRVWRHVYTSVVSGLVRTPHRVRRTSSGAGILAWCLSGSFWGGALWSTPDSRVSSLTRTVSLFRHHANPSPHAVRCFLQSRTLDWR